MSQILNKGNVNILEYVILLKSILKVVPITLTVWNLLARISFLATVSFL